MCCTDGTGGALEASSGERSHCMADRATIPCLQPMDWQTVAVWLGWSVEVLHQVELIRGRGFPPLALRISAADI